jgi:hypothetical protein
VELSFVEPRDSLSPDAPSLDMSITALPDGSFESQIGIVDGDRWYQVSSSKTGTDIGVAGDLSSHSLAALRDEVPEGKDAPSLVKMHASTHNDGWYHFRALRERHQESVPTTGDDFEEDEADVTGGNAQDSQEGAMAMNAQLRRLADGGRPASERRNSSKDLTASSDHLPTATAAFRDLVAHLDDKVLNHHMKLAEAVDHQRAANVAKMKKVRS